MVFYVNRRRLCPGFGHAKANLLNVDETIAAELFKFTGNPNTVHLSTTMHLMISNRVVHGSERGRIR